RQLQTMHIIAKELQNSIFIRQCSVAYTVAVSSFQPLPVSTVPTAIANEDGDWPWRSDLGNGHYRNPILHADYSDPDAVRVGNDFWLTASSFNCTPGLPILHSRDLVNWRLVNHAVENLPHPRFEQVQHGCGIWAPAIRYHGGKFWIFFPMPDEGIYVTTADDPAGRWSPPHLMQAGKGLIDPCPLWDDDGNAYLVHAYAGSRAGIKHRLRICPMAPDGSRLLGDGEVVFHQPEKHPTLEGPKFLKREGWYYILAPAGGVATGWQLALRSRNIFGPYEDKVLLAQGRTAVNGPHQGALLDTPAGDWWFLHFQDAGVYGRIVHLQPVHWENGWPLMGAPGTDSVGEPVLEHVKPQLPGTLPDGEVSSDNFINSNLALPWQWNANHKPDWYSLTARPAWLRLFAQPLPSTGLNDTPNLLLQKFPARQFAVQTQVDMRCANHGDEAGLIIFGRASAALAVQSGPAGFQIISRHDNSSVRLAQMEKPVAQLKVTVKEGGQCAFSFLNGEGKWISAPETFQAQPGVWIGAKVGLYSIRTGEKAGGYADFNYFRMQSLSHDAAKDVGNPVNPLQKASSRW
ncbi:MAG TPA: glycoside hydrolase 43 family protein, partial [Verrucomicrobiae bacterium]